MKTIRKTRLPSHGRFIAMVRKNHGLEQKWISEKSSTLSASNIKCKPILSSGNSQNFEMMLCAENMPPPLKCLPKQVVINTWTSRVTFIFT